MRVPCGETASSRTKTQRARGGGERGESLVTTTLVNAWPQPLPITLNDYHHDTRVQRGGATLVPVLRAGPKDARVVVEGEGVLPIFGSRERAARCKITQKSRLDCDRTIARVDRRIAVVRVRRGGRDGGREAGAGTNRSKLRSQSGGARKPVGVLGSMPRYTQPTGTNLGERVPSLGR